MKKALLIITKIAFSGGLIYWILQKTDLATIWEAVKSANLFLVITAFLMFYIGYFIIAKRQQILLNAQNIHVSIPTLLQSFSIGMFFSNLLPSTIGGDASRMYDIYRAGGSKTKAVSIILIDRFFGMFALVVFGFGAALFSSEIRDAIPGIALYMGLLFFAMVTVLWLVFGSGAKILEWFLQLNLGPFSFIQKILNKIVAGFELFKGRGDVLRKAVMWSCLLQLNVVIHYIILTYALNLNVPPLAMFVIVPVAVILMLAPVSINGIGLRDALFVWLLGIYGVAVESAAAFAWISLAMVLGQGIVGGIVFLFRRNANTPPKNAEV